MTVFTNEPSVALYLNGEFFQSKEVTDHKAVFADVPLADGENTVTAKTGHTEDTIRLEGVAEHDDTYDFPDVIEALRAGNWFAENDDQLPEVKNGFHVGVPVGELLANENCYRIVRGWIMANTRLLPETKLAIVPRLTNWQAMWGDRQLGQLAMIKNHMTPEDLETLDKMLRRIKR